MTDTPTKPHAKVRVVRPASMPVIYAEGIAGMMVGFPNSRIMMSQLMQPNGEGDTAEEVHQLACELVIPTAALIEIAQAVLTNLGGSKEVLQNAGAEWAQKVIDVIGSLPSAPSPSNIPDNSGTSS